MVGLWRVVVCLFVFGVVIVCRVLLCVDLASCVLLFNVFVLVCCMCGVFVVCLWLVLLCCGLRDCVCCACVVPVVCGCCVVLCVVVVRVKL